MRAVICLVAALVTAVEAQVWPGFRGPGGSGVGDGLALPLRWDVPAGVNVAWTAAIPGLGHSSPIIWGDRVFVTTAVPQAGTPQFRAGFYSDGYSADDGTPHAWKVYAFDLQTGRVLWERVAHRGVPRTRRHPKSTQASATPVTDGRHLIAFFGSEGLYAYDLDGKLLWSQDLGLLDPGSVYYPDRQWGAASSPVIVGDLVIVQCDRQRQSFIAAFDVASGKRIWTTPRDEVPSWATPAAIRVGARTEVVTNGGRFIRGYDAASGRELWRLPNTSLIAVPTPVGTSELLVVSSGYQPSKPIFAIRLDGAEPVGGTEGPRSPTLAWSSERGGPYIATPLVYRDLLYITSSNGILSAYEARTGRKLYEQRIADKAGAYSSSAVAADGRLYLGSEDGEVHVVRAGPEYELLATNQVGDPILATPALAQGMIVLRTTRSLYGIGSAGGRKTADGRR